MEIFRDIKMLFHYGRTPLIRTLVIRTSYYPEYLDLYIRFIENSTKLTCLENTRYLVKYSTVLWLL